MADIAWQTLLFVFESLAMGRRVKPGLQIVATIDEYVCDDSPKRILKLSSKYFLWKYDTCDHYNDIDIKPHLEGLKKHARKHVLAILAT